MNKKFSTLLAGLALASSVASAADIQLNVGSNDGLYQIKSGSKVLAIQNDAFVLVDPTTLDAADLASTLWCVTIDDFKQGQTPLFDFRNKKEGRLLEVYMDAAMKGLTAGAKSDPLEVSDEADINGWAFSSTYKEEVEDNKPLFSYFTADSILALEVSGSDLVAAKYSAKQIGSLSAQFSLVKPSRMTLNADALNTLLGMNSTGTSFKLTYDKQATGNVFANELVAVSDTLTDYVTVVNKSTGNYLRVDTAFNNTTGVGFVKLTDTTKVSTYIADVNATGKSTDHYAFKFEYVPNADSVIITVKGAYLNADKLSPWSSYKTTLRDSLHVYVQDLVTSSVLTVGTDSSFVKLGFGTCGDAPATTKTTVKSDLYVIKGANGKYLAVPIHGDSTAQWVTLEKNVNPWTMPSFQWVVEQLRDTETSPIKITNREFSKINISSVQLDKVKGQAVTYGSVTDSLKATSFTAATAAIKADSLLGYKNLDPQDLMVNRYKFRYLHEFSDDKYVGVNNEENDSILYVGDGSPFSLKSVSNLTRYGYTSSKVADLKPLYRRTYTMKIRNPKLIFGAKADSVALDKEGRFSVSENLRPDTFLLKANNEKAIEDLATLFYAFIKVNADTVKVGVDDNNLWVKSQIMTESRTSAFSVEKDKSPLYRRFNTLKEGEEANDKPDTVKFLRVNNPADMLFVDTESVYSKGLGIKFLGVQNNVQYPNANYSMYVDTAYVNRGNGEIKPQYMLAVSVEVIPGKDPIPCPLDHNHGYDKDGNVLDKWTCSHATPGTDGYVRGRYLINTVDSAKVGGDYHSNAAVRDKDYIWNNQVRLAFVDAIHKNDTLYILKGDTSNWADPIDLSKLPNKIRLDNDKHKNVTFSFRLLEEGNDDFLIESQSTDGQDIAPMQGGWVKIQNGVPVVSYAAFNDAANEAEYFNVVKTAEKPVANESISTSGVSVIAKAGAVVVKGAAGKNVIISNVLGQTLANTVLSSDEATISAPAGVVVVAVEGEEAVKAIVK